MLFEMLMLKALLPYILIVPPRKRVRFAGPIGNGRFPTPKMVWRYEVSNWINHGGNFHNRQLKDHAVFWMCPIDLTATEISYIVFNRIDTLLYCWCCRTMWLMIWWIDRSHQIAAHRNRISTHIHISEGLGSVFWTYWFCTYIYLLLIYIVILIS